MRVIKGFDAEVLASLNADRSGLEDLLRSLPVDPADNVIKNRSKRRRRGKDSS
jgi:hypothetical protein